MSSLQEFFNRPEHDHAKGIVQKNNIIKRSIIAYMAVHGECTLAELARELHISIPTVTKLVEELAAPRTSSPTGARSRPAADGAQRLSDWPIRRSTSPASRSAATRW